MYNNRYSEAWLRLWGYKIKKRLMKINQDVNNIPTPFTFLASMIHSSMPLNIFSFLAILFSLDVHTMNTYKVSSPIIDHIIMGIMPTGLILWHSWTLQ